MCHLAQNTCHLSPNTCKVPCHVECQALKFPLPATSSPTMLIGLRCVCEFRRARARQERKRARYKERERERDECARVRMCASNVDMDGG